MSATLICELQIEELLETAAPPHPRCRAVVIVPARNEQAALPATLDALRRQVDRAGKPLSATHYEVVLLLNNCTDRSVSVARSYARRYPKFALHIEERELPPERAHVGTARRLLMDAACRRLKLTDGGLAILSTDADTLVAPDWVAANLAAIEEGAEVVGGVIHLLPGELESLEPGIQAAYKRDRIYQARVAELEGLLDPDPADPWPRHLEHFGASLACTPEIYRRCGGLPPVKPLEDVAFIDALRKVGARIRHSSDVHIYTSARLDGRAEVGLSGQLRHWQRDCAEDLPHVVDSAEWLAHRFRMLAELRRISGAPSCAETTYPEPWPQRIADVHAAGLTTPRFLEQLDCNALIEQTFEGNRHGEIAEVIERLEAAIAMTGTTETP